MISLQVGTLYKYSERIVWATKPECSFVCITSPQGAILLFLGPVKEATTLWPPVGRCWARWLYGDTIVYGFATKSKHDGTIMPVCDPGYIKKV
jgi:hypothetical protein